MRRRLATALVAGSLAGGVVGLVDALSTWTRLHQFTPGAGGKLHTALLAAALLALVLGLGTLLVTLVGTLVVRATALARLSHHAAEQHTLAAARDPRQALVGLSLVIAGLPVLAGALGLAYAIGMRVITTRKHTGLVIVVTVLATLACLLVAAVITLLVGKLVELALRRLPGRALRLASSIWSPMVAALGLLAVALPVGYALGRKPLSLDQLQLRPHAVLLCALLALPLAWPLAARIIRRLSTARPRLRRNVLPALVALLAGLVLLLGRAEGPRKAAGAFTGLSAPLMQGIRRVVDLDRDGYSPLLGGGDCDDWNGGIRPGAFDTPDDGVDQNCAGGDLRLARTPADLRFVERPASIPADFNVVFITVDALRADHLGAYGYARDTSPTMDALASEGTLFVNGWAHAPSTRYSVPAILTGRYPSQVRWDDSVWWPALQPDNLTLAEVMKAQGLTTGAILNYHYFDRVRRMDQGFDSYDNDNARLHKGSDPASTEGSSAREQTDKAIAFVEQHAQGRFFLWVHYYDTHYKWQHHPGGKVYGGKPMDLYDGEIRYTDDQLARLVARLRALGLYDRTIFVVTGDHGEGFGEHGIEFHGYHLYRAQTQVPFIVRVPGAPAGKVALPVGHIDLLPTLANLAGASPSPDFQGRSLLGEILGQGTPDGDRDVYQEVTFEGPTRRYAVATRRWHLLYNQVPDNTWELYDLAGDPEETRDVMGGPDVSDLAGRLAQWVDGLALPPGAAEKLASAVLAARPAPTTPVTADFGGKVRLLGADLPAQAVRAGERARIVYYLESLAPVAEDDWKLFVHLDGPAHFQDDHVPVDGALPFSRMAPGQLIADVRELTVPRHLPAGDYAIVVGLWRRGSGNLPATGAGAADLGKGRVRVGTLRVTR
jgi:choline-sulfatase